MIPLSTSLTLLLLAAPSPAPGLYPGTGQEPPQVPEPNKGGFSLLNPTPRSLWRPLSADRPDFTESPYTVDAGAVQLEMSFIDYARNGDADAWTFAPANLKIGLLNNLDLQLVVDPHVRADDGIDTHRGFGDTQIRMKLNLWGNDGGDTAMAIMPFVKMPTASGALSNDHVEGGLIFSFATELPGDLGLGLMFETDFVYDEVDDNYDTEFIATGALGFNLTEELGMYIEGIGISSTDGDTDFRGIVGMGATYSLTDNLMLDAGVNIGLTGDADDVNIFTGVTIRF